MKLFTLIIPFLIGSVASSLSGWEPGKEYRFQYSGRLLNGLPQLNNHFSGVGVNATVSLKVKTPNQFYLTVEDARFVAVNQELQSQGGTSNDEGNGWRNLRLPEMRPVPQEHARSLKLPITFTMREDGAIEHLKVDQKDTLWSRNFKKALVNLFQVKVQAGSPDMVKNMIQSPVSEDSSFWKVKEQWIIGQCEATYKVNPLPDYVIRQDPALASNPNCQGKKYYEIVRNMDFDKCDRFGSYQYFGTGHWQRCASDTMTNCDSFFTRISSIRTIACGSPSSGKLSVQAVISDGEMNTMLLGHNTEVYVTGTRQNLTLVGVTPASSYPEIQQPVQLKKGLLYDFTKNPSQGPPSANDIAMSYPPNFLTGVSESNPKIDAGGKVIDILKDMAGNIHGVPGTKLSESQLGMKLLTAARGFTLIETTEELMNLYHGVQSGSSSEITESVKQLFLDALAISGTPQAIEFFGQAYKAGSVGEKEMMHFFYWLPHNSITPTESVLNGIFRMVTSDVIKSKPTMYNIAITGFTQLVQQACVSPKRLMEYPTWVFGEFCRPESKIVQEVLIPYLSSESRKAGASNNYKNIHVVSLGLLTHKNVIGELTPLVEKSGGSSLRRMLALYSLSNVGQKDPNLVYPIFQTLFANPGESTEARIVAFNSLLKLNPPTQVFNTIVHATHQEQTMDYELLKTINIAFYSLGHTVDITRVPMEQVQLVKKCRDAYVMVKKTYGITPSSGTYYRTEFMKDFESGYQGILSWIASQESILPKSLYLKFNFFMETVSFDAFEFGYRIKGADSLFEKVSDALNGQSGESGSIMDQIQQGLSTEWKKVIEKLKLEDRKSSKLSGALYARNFGSGIFFKSFTHSIMEKIVSLIKNPSLSSINGENKVNLQKSFLMNPYVMVIPSEMGFPINMEIFTPNTISLIGNVNLNTEKSNPWVSLDTKVLFSGQITGFVGTTIPFTEEYALTGMDQHLLYHLPGMMKFDVSVPDQKVSVTIKPGSGSNNGETDIWHYHVMPYTVLEKIRSLVPHTKSQGMKVIRSTSRQKTGAYRFGQNMGLSLGAKYQTESAFTDWRSILETIKMFHYSPFNIGFFVYLVPAFNNQMRPSTRLQRYTLTMNPSESSTKKIRLEFKVGSASMFEGKQAQYHSLKAVSESERLESVKGASPSVLSLVKKVFPYRVESVPISSVNKHGVRVEKLRATMKGLGLTQSAHGLSILTSVVLEGNRPKTFTYSFSVATGQQAQESKKVQQKWNLHLESSDSSESQLPKKVCVNGKLDLPLLPIWNVELLRSSLAQFHYQNQLSFGWQQCSESTIFTKGVARVSSRQQSYSMKTPEAKKCQMGSELSRDCQLARDQASTLDEIEFTSELKNVPKMVGVLDTRAVGILKAYLWPYYNFKASSSQDSEFSGQNYQTKTLITFKQNTPSFDLTITRPQEVVTFANVHIPEPYSLLFPMRAGMSTMSSIRRISGSAIYPACKVDSKTVTSYDNKTIQFSPDKCFHLLTADCSKYKRFGVTVRNVEGDKKEVKVFLKKVVVLLTPSGSGEPKVSVDGQQVSVSPNSDTKISHQGKTLATVTMSVDRVITLKAPSLYLEQLHFNGKLISVVPSPMLKNKMCGLCGDYNLERKGDIAGPKQCVYSNPELKVASYRIQTGSCPAMSSHVKQQLWKETDQCSKYHVETTKVAKSYKINTGKCTLLRHVIMQQPGQICISKVQVTQCGPSCKTKPSELVEKSVPFTCLPHGSLADLYVWKVHEGKLVEELKTMETSFKVSLQQPRHCVHALVP